MIVPAFHISRRQRIAKAHRFPISKRLRVNAWPRGLTPEQDRRDEWTDLTYAIASRRALIYQE